MKLLAKGAALFVAAGFFSAIPALAVENGMGTDQQTQKDECLLALQNCRDNVDTIQQRIQRLDREIGKGTSVYTSKELRQLKDERDDAVDLMRAMVESGGS